MKDEQIRFDMYSAMIVRQYGRARFEVVQIIENVSLLCAVIMADVDERDFVESVANDGWVGTCPHWAGRLPVVTLPVGDKLDMDHLEFMVESL